MSIKDTKFPNQVSYFYEFVSKNQVRATVAVPDLEGVEINSVREIDRDELPGSIYQTLERMRGELKRLDISIGDKVDLVKNIFQWTDKVSLLNQEFALMTNSNPTRFAWAHMNRSLIDLVTTRETEAMAIFKEGLFKVLNYSYLLKGNRVTVSGNPYYYEGNVEDTMVYLLPTLEASIGSQSVVEIINNGDLSIVSLLAGQLSRENQPLELFYTRFERFSQTLPNLARVFFQAQFSEFDLVTVKQKSFDRFNQTMMLLSVDQYPSTNLSTTNTKVGLFLEKVGSSHCQEEVDGGFSIREGFTSNITFSYRNPSQNEQTDLNLAKIFDSITTSEMIPFIKYATGQKSASLSKETADRDIHYNRINVKFAQNSKYSDRVVYWTNTNRRLHHGKTKPVGVKNDSSSDEKKDTESFFTYFNDYNNEAGEVVIFELYISENSYASVYLKV